MMKNNLRILAFNWKDIKHPQAGGAEVFTHEVLTRLSKKGAKVTLFAPNPKGQLKQVEEVDGITIVRKGTVFTSIVHGFFFYMKHKQEFDLVMDQINVIPFFTPLYVRKPKFFLIHQITDKVWFYQLPKWIGIFGYLAEKLYLQVYRNQVCATVSQSTKDALLGLGFKENNIIIVNEGLDIPVKKALSPKENLQNIQYLGCIRPMKGVLDIVKAFEILQKSYPKLTLTIVGKSHCNYKAKIKKYISGKEIHNIEWIDGVEQEEKHLAYDLADVIVMASALEGWGLVASEAHARGIPTVVYNSRGLRDSTTHMRDGFVTKHNKPQELAEGIEYFILNPDNYMKAQKNAIEGVKELDWDITTDQFESIMTAVMEKKEKRRSMLQSLHMHHSLKENSTTIPLVSVIIPTKNSSAFIRPSLESIRKQTYPNIEIIVVDNSSSDATQKIAKEFTDKVYTRGNERSAQMNYGVSRAKGKYIYRVDADFIVDPTVIEEAVHLCETAGHDGVAIHNSSDPTVSFWSKVRHLERECYRNDDDIVGIRFWSRESFLEIGGFDESLSAAEDYEIHNRFIEHGYTFGRIQAKELHLGEPKTLGEFARKSYYYGKTMGGYIKGNTNRAIKQFNPLRPAYMKHWKEMVRHPILVGGLFVMTVVKYSMGFAGLLSAKFNK